MIRRTGRDEQQYNGLDGVYTLQILSAEQSKYDTKKTQSLGELLRRSPDCPHLRASQVFPHLPLPFTGIAFPNHIFISRSRSNGY